MSAESVSALRLNGVRLNGVEEREGRWNALAVDARRAAVRYCIFVLGLIVKDSR